MRDLQNVVNRSRASIWRPVVHTNRGWTPQTSSLTARVAVEVFV